MTAQPILIPQPTLILSVPVVMITQTILSPSTWPLTVVLAMTALTTHSTEPVPNVTRLFVSLVIQIAHGQKTTSLASPVVRQPIPQIPTSAQLVSLTMEQLPLVDAPLVIPFSLPVVTVMTTLAATLVQIVTMEPSQPLIMDQPPSVSTP